MSRISEIFRSLIRIEGVTRPGLVVETIAVASCRVTLSFQNEELHKSYFPPLAHIREKSLIRSDLNIEVVKSSPLTTDLESIVEFRSEQRPNLAPGKVHTLFLRNDGEVLAIQQRDNELLAVDYYSRNQAKAVVWTNSDLENSEYAHSHYLTSPFRSIFAWHFQNHSSYLIHASAVGDSEFGLIFVGPGGSGKSNAALGLLDTGMEYLGDDSVLISNLNGPEVFSLYSSARLNPADSSCFDFDENTKILREDGEKLRVYLGSRYRRKSPLTAVVALKPNQKDCSYSKTSFMDGFMKIAPNSMMHVPGIGQEYLSSIAGVLRGLSWYELSLTLDRKENSKIIRELVEVAR